MNHLPTFTFVLFLLHGLYTSINLLGDDLRVWHILYDQVEWPFNLRILLALGSDLSIALKDYSMPYRVLPLRYVLQSRSEFSNISK